MLERLSRTITRWSLARPWTVSSIFFVLLLTGAVGASQLEARLNYLELLPDTTDEIIDLRWVMNKAGSEGYLVSEITGGTREQRIALAKAIVDRHMNMPDFRYAEYRYDVQFFRKNIGWLLPLSNLQALSTELDRAVENEVERRLDLGLDDEDEPASKPAGQDITALNQKFDEYAALVPKEYIEDESGTRLYVLSKPARAGAELTTTQAIVGRTREVSDALLQRPEFSGLHVELGGPMLFQLAFDHGMRKDLGIISGVALVLALVFLLFATRRLIASALILAPIVIAISVTLGLTALTIGHITIISGLLVAIILGLGVEFGIHLVLRTRESRVEHRINAALMEAVPETMSGAFSGALTNGAAFAVLTFADFKAFREFGAIAAVGVCLSWLFTYTLLPALVLLVERARPGWVIAPSTIQEGELRVPMRVWRTVVWLVPLLAVFGVLLVPKLGVEKSFSALHKEHPDPVGVRAQIAMNMTLTPMVIWTASLADARRVEAIFQDLIDEDKRPEGSILSHTISLARLTHEGDEAERGALLADIDKSLKRIPKATREKLGQRLGDLETAVHAERVLPSQIPVEFRRKFESLDGHGTFVLVINRRSLDFADSLEEFVATCDEGLRRARAQGIYARAMSENRVAVAIFRQVFSDAPFIAWAASLVAFVTLLVLLRSLGDALIVFVPIVIGMSLMVLGMVVTGVKLNFINMSVIPSIFTVAIDNTVHLFHRYRHEGPKQMPRIMRNTGIAVLMATCVNASGYAPMTLADFYGLRSLGYLASFGMIGMLLGTVVWFPALLMLLPDRRKRSREAADVQRVASS